MHQHLGERWGWWWMRPPAHGCLFWNHPLVLLSFMGRTKTPVLAHFQTCTICGKKGLEETKGQDQLAAPAQTSGGKLNGRPLLGERALSQGSQHRLCPKVHTQGLPGKRSLTSDGASEDDTLVSLGCCPAAAYVEMPVAPKF